MRFQAIAIGLFALIASASAVDKCNGDFCRGHNCRDDPGKPICVDVSTGCHCQLG
ncbi:hypothetical protein C8035_v009262 [Colletotrichum spinosum]|uniref:Uncharacterized protein n=1 Tax=Colletotrichum spinosum TaxID=1347390 RepID=A0A4R8QAJ7_9PEZI|nr:hypothetical protein C8035_v009262 [Colletotrichum spinosum]